MAKNKLTKDDKHKIKYLIAKFIYKKEGLDKLEEEREKLIEDFKVKSRETYYSIFNIKKEMIDFANKYDVTDWVSLSIDQDYRTNENIHDKFDPDGCSRDWNFYTTSCIWQDFHTFKLPFYNKLSYLPLEKTLKDYGSFYDLLHKKYKECLYDNLLMTSSKSKTALETYKTFDSIIDLCFFDVDVLEHIQIPEITEYFEKRFGKKLSTDLCTVNKEKIDFIKNYLKQVDNE
jgi:hypothetical protein